MNHVGIDVHKGASQICMITEGGELIERRVRTEASRLAEALEGEARADFDRGVDGARMGGAMLEQLGHDVIVADPNFAPMYATRQRKVKTDRRDARATD
jgi:transposase